jgi:hypothetical protein
MLITAAIALPFAWGRGPSSRFAVRLQVATALISIAFGALLAWQIGFEQGLFSTDPRWSPH